MDEESERRQAVLFGELARVTREHVNREGAEHLADVLIAQARLLVSTARSMGSAIEAVEGEGEAPETLEIVQAAIVQATTPRLRVVE